eukprot:2939323-Pleurochrysis_carterae.AAC.2
MHVCARKPLRKSAGKHEAVDREQPNEHKLIETEGEVTDRKGEKQTTKKAGRMRGMEEDRHEREKGREGKRPKETVCRERQYVEREAKTGKTGCRSAWGVKTGREAEITTGTARTCVCVWRRRRASVRQSAASTLGRCRSNASQHT